MIYIPKKNMHDVSNAINILDPLGSGDNGINWKYCKDGSGNNNDEAKKCQTKTNIGKSGGNNNVGLAKMFSADNTALGSTDTVKQHTAETISKETSALTREEHGVVSSAFAKAHVGAEIPA